MKPFEIALAMAKIQFIAHHEIQAQVFLGIIPLLSAHECIISIGQDVSVEEGVEIIVLADHLAFQRNVKPAKRYLLVHMCHDIADLDVYSQERFMIKYFCLILCPSEEHLILARKTLPKVNSFYVGWQKNTPMQESSSNFPDKHRTVILAPTEIADLNWQPILDELLNSKYRVLIKNHIYWHFEDGVPPPRGQEARYLRHLEEMKKMDEYVKQRNSKDLVLIDRKSNIRLIFPEAFLLITDSSSAAAEFQNFGASIELGVLDKKSGKRLPEISKNFKDVTFMLESELLTNIKQSRIRKETEGFQKMESLLLKPLRFNIEIEPDQLSAFLIHSLAFRVNKNSGKANFFFIAHQLRRVKLKSRRIITRMGLNRVVR